MFQASVCPSSGDLTVFMRHWYLSFGMGCCPVCWLEWLPTTRPDNHPYRVTSTKCLKINILKSMFN